MGYSTYAEDNKSSQTFHQFSVNHTAVKSKNLREMGDQLEHEYGPDIDQSCTNFRGEYPQYPRQTPQDEEEDEVELDSEESESF
ncbi:hypothetical protein F2Q68_00021324 [Brassica cretica]|uniref:Uncharacterized protein n=1 Tax=Brassica cretica TaxID=69181 RepID=A0A8S9G888_BRACR|nr:hypothetical protein F2Q68_00021324 [Brassica cretica]